MTAPSIIDLGAARAKRVAEVDLTKAVVDLLYEYLTAVADRGVRAIVADLDGGAA